MDKPAEKLKHGKTRTIVIPLSSEKDIFIHLIFIEKLYYHHSDSRRYLTKVYIYYKEKRIIHNIVEVYRFISSIKAFVDRKINFMDEDIYFVPKSRDNVSRLQCVFDLERYISMVEAMQINRILQDAFFGYSKVHIFDDFTTKIENLITK